MSLQNSFVAALFHDGKKLLLNTHPNAENWGTQRPDQLRWDDLETQGDISDIGFDASMLPIFENSEQLLLIKLHQRLFDPEKLGFDPQEKVAELSGLDNLAVFSLLASDALHKALYGAERELQEGSLRCPIFVPFYSHDPDGRATVWMPVDFDEAMTLPVNDIQPLAVSDQVAFANPRKQFRQMLQTLKAAKAESENPAEFLTATQMMALQSAHFSHFPDTTYLPTTSQAFHHRFVAALLLLLYPQLRRYRCTPQNRQEIEIQLYLNTIFHPPEGLSNRLRDASGVRKITDRLRLAFHHHFRDEYLSELARFGFDHPTQNPFFFYNRDATVMINGGEDQAAIGTICQRLAQETESILTLTAIEINATVTITLQSLPKDGADFSQISLFEVELTPRQRLMVDADARTESVPPKPFFGIAEPSKSATPTDAENAGYCHSCNKGEDLSPIQPDAPTQQPEVTWTDDLLCERCYTLRRKHRVCSPCELYFPPGQFQKGRCPVCNERVRAPETTPLLQGVGPQNYRLAYISIETNSSVAGISEEAEVRMATARELRRQFERPRATPRRWVIWNGETAPSAELTPDDGRIITAITELLNKDPLTTNELKLRLERLQLGAGDVRRKVDEYIEKGWLCDQETYRLYARWRPTADRLFEYLQSVLSMDEFQREMFQRLKETMAGLKDQKTDGYPVRDRDLSDDSLRQQVLYRSPTRTLLVLPEEGLRTLYARLLKLTHRLQIAHRLRMVTCSQNTPVWRVFAELQRDTPEPFLADNGLKAAMARLSTVAEPLKTAEATKRDLVAAWDADQKLLKAYAKVSRPLRGLTLRVGRNESIPLSPQELRLTVIRGSAPRIFTNAEAHRLLTFEAQTRAAPTQVHGLAEFASQLCAQLQPSDSVETFLANFNLEIDARSNPQRRMRPNERLPVSLANALKDEVSKLLTRIRAGDENVKLETIPAYLRELAHLHKIPMG